MALYLSMEAHEDLYDEAVDLWVLRCGLGLMEVFICGCLYAHTMASALRTWTA